MRPQLINGILNHLQNLPAILPLATPGPVQRDLTPPPPLSETNPDLLTAIPLSNSEDEYFDAVSSVASTQASASTVASLALDDKPPACTPSSTAKRSRKRRRSSLSSLTSQLELEISALFPNNSGSKHYSVDTIRRCVKRLNTAASNSSLLHSPINDKKTYSSITWLLLRFEDVCSEIKEEMSDFDGMVKDKLQHETVQGIIPRAISQQVAERIVQEFMTNYAMDPSSLIVIYYGGHGRNEDAWWLSESKSKVRWEPIIEMILASRADVLIIIDACHAGAAVYDFIALQRNNRESSSTKDGVATIELLTTTDHASTTRLSGPHTFTKRLAHVLSALHWNESIISINVLLRDLLPLYVAAHDSWRPCHTSLQGDERSIILGRQDPYCEQGRIENMAPAFNADGMESTMIVAFLRDGRPRQSGPICVPAANIRLRYRGVTLQLDMPLSVLDHIKSARGGGDSTKRVFAVQVSIKDNNNCYGGTHKGCLGELYKPHEPCPLSHCGSLREWGKEWRSAYSSR
ncbi:hypothetical protein EJ08DRAFT_660825 [Tothia fuscella]|uniref:Uncharacterized protein n=1 Tax=Tothia fuscella TaxID=1048955 RepID=A0A9P4NRJ4_9PEZI|nr:hypothetical protein EJ08DRAFT_660825 [Tothia fuscella]